MDFSSEPYSSVLYYSVSVVVVSVVLFALDAYVLSLPFALSYLSWSSVALTSGIYVIILLALFYLKPGATEGLTEVNLNTLIFIFIYSILLSFVLNIFGVTAAVALFANTLLMMYYFYRRVK